MKLGIQLHPSLQASPPPAKTELSAARTLEYPQQSWRSGLDQLWLQAARESSNTETKGLAHLIKIDGHFDSLLALIACSTEPVSKQRFKPQVAALKHQGPTQTEEGGGVRNSTEHGYKEEVCD